MDAQAILALLEGAKGQHVQFTWERTLQTLRGVEHVVKKRTTMYVRAGIEYSNLKSVREGIESGERGAVQPLAASDVWVHYPFILKNTSTGAEKIRVYPPVLLNLPRAETTYTIDGRPASFDEVRPLCRASEFSKRDGTPPPCFTIKTADVVAVGSN